MLSEATQYHRSLWYPPAFPCPQPTPPFLCLLNIFDTPFYTSSSSILSACKTTLYYSLHCLQSEQNIRNYVPIIDFSNFLIWQNFDTNILNIHGVFYYIDGTQHVALNFFMSGMDSLSRIQRTLHFLPL